ncbi:biotin synthase BioB [Candidatus Lariskella endosymbiont of Epinotia ramella]|uniref:biotin synthase BioB n=1 Tax=Candidatus Lariskella endosymbiont of Epinotia ramella TaxID=3066224 RepID=UPI0030CEB408
MTNSIKRWSLEEANALFNQPFFDLIYSAHTVLKEHFDQNTVQVSTLLNIKTGGCPENCKYCSQSAHYKTELKKEPLSDLESVMNAARSAKESGATRFCMGAAWRSPSSKDLMQTIEMIKGVKSLGMETCATFGLLNSSQASLLKEAGLDYYNHNIDTSEDFYPNVITTRTFQDRLDTIKCVREAGMSVCCGGIIGMGESLSDRIKMLMVLANLDKPPESVPLNLLVKIPGTPLEAEFDVEPFEFVRLVALARVMMPRSYIRLSAGRVSMSEELQALCLFAGANSIFAGDKLLTTENNTLSADEILFQKLGLKKLLEANCEPI